MSDPEHAAIQVELGYIKANQDDIKKDVNELFNLVRGLQITIAEKRGASNLVNGVMLVASSSVAVLVSKLVG